MTLVGFTSRSHLETMMQRLRGSQDCQPWHLSCWSNANWPTPGFHVHEENNANLFNWLVAKFSVFLIYIWQSTNTNILPLFFLLKHFCCHAPIFLGSPGSSSVGLLSCYPPHPSQLAKDIHSASRQKAGDRNWKTQLPTSRVCCSLHDVVVEKCSSSVWCFLPAFATAFSFKKFIWKCHYFTYVLEGYFCSVYATKCIVIFFQFFKNIISLSLVSTVSVRRNQPSVYLLPL